MESKSEMQKTRLKLNPCSCGGEMEIKKVAQNGGMDGTYWDWKLTCNKCGLTRIYAADNFYGRKYKTFDEVVNDWNKEKEKIIKMTIEKTETFVEHDIIVAGTKVGTVELCPERMELSRLNIYEPYQNKGYGTEVVKNLVKQGYKSLWVRSDNPRAIHVYEKCGFKKGNTHMFEMVVDRAESEG